MAWKKNGKSPNSHPLLDQHALRELAVEAMVDPRTIVAYLHHYDQKSTTRARVEAALIKRGYERLVHAHAAGKEKGG